MQRLSCSPGCLITRSQDKWAFRQDGGRSYCFRWKRRAITLRSRIIKLSANQKKEFSHETDIALNGKSSSEVQLILA